MKNHVMIAHGELAVAPLESDHVFAGSEHLCRICGRPRAFHLNDGFMPKETPSFISRLPKARYRGGHPFFSKATMTVMNPVKNPPSYQAIRRELEKLDSE